MKEFLPDQSLEKCHAALEALFKDARDVSHAMLDGGNEELAEMLTIIFIAGQTQTMIVWHLINNLEKKIDALLSNKKTKRFEVDD